MYDSMNLILKQAIFCSLRVAFFAHYLSIGGKQKQEQGEVNNWQKDVNVSG
jgi:hypothetical protein